mgnify:CR=1 FL=1
MLIEICVDSLEGALAAERGGADRLELCSGLGEGGVTPGAGLVTSVCREVEIDVHAMIRPRGGDFHYSTAELSVMREEIRVARDLGVAGVVLGCLKENGDVDLGQVESLTALARPCNVTFHRAFDMCRDPREALDGLLNLGVDRILTSGQEANCLAGVSLIAELQERAAGRIAVMPGGGVTLENVREIAAGSGVGEIHLSARSMVESGMRHRNPRCSMGAGGAEEYRWKTTDEAIVRAVVERFR